jgi:hypothetical protein
MALLLAKSVEAVLLADGWHKVDNASFRLEASQACWSEARRLLVCPESSVLAVRCLETKD